MSVQWTYTTEALSTLESKVKCCICNGLPVDPQMLWCKHSFCLSCVKDKPKCPICQFPTSPQEMVSDIMLNKLLHAMKVAAHVSKCSQNPDDSKNPISLSTSEKDHQYKNIGVKDIVTKNTNSIKSSRNRSYEVKHVTTDEKENLSNKTDNSKIKALRSSSRWKSPQKQKQDLELAEPERRSRRMTSPQKHKLEFSGINSVKPKPLKCSPKASSNKNDVMSTPKTKPKPKNMTPILYSAKKVQNTNKVNSKGETPLQIACRQGKLSLVQQLLREGAQPNVKDYASWTPLCDAVGSGNLDVVRALLQAGACVNTPANLNTTALVEAVVRRNRAMLELLMEHGADMHQRTALGNTAWSLADDEMRALLLSFDHVTPPPPPFIPTNPRAVYVDTQLPPPQLERVMDLCRQFNLTLSTEFTEDITHIVVNKSAANTCTATTPVMLAIVSGCCVTGIDWVGSCLEAGKLVDIEEFEPCGTTDYPTSDVFHKARVNKERLLPRLFDGCHISLQQDQPWSRQLKADTVSLVTAAGAVYQPRQCDPERVPEGESTVMYHANPTGPLGAVSHVILYQAGPPSQEPLLKYNMVHAKSLSLSWFYKCIQNFSVGID